MNQKKAFLSSPDSSKTSIDSTQTSLPDLVKSESVKIDSIQNIMPKTSLNKNDSIKTKTPSYHDDKPLGKDGEYPVYDRKSKTAQSFRKFFSEALKAGKKEFTWQNRKYTTRLSEEVEK